MNIMPLPSIERQYQCMRILADCYQNFKFDDLYPLLTDNVKWFSQWSSKDVDGKENVIEYFKDKEKSDRENYFGVSQIVQLIGNMNENSNVRGNSKSGNNPGRVMLFYDDGKLCVFFSQYIDGRQSNMMIVPEYDGEKISRIGICLPDFYRFRTYRPGNGEQVDWGKGIPKYKETDLLRDEELCDFACNIVNDCFIKKEGYEILFASNHLNAFPNFALKKDGKIILVIVRGCGAPNMPSLNSIEKDYFIKEAHRQGLEIYFAPVGFGASDPERFDKGLLLRGDGFYANFKGIEPLE